MVMLCMRYLELAVSFSRVSLSTGMFDICFIRKMKMMMMMMMMLVITVVK